jgi:hypothetical protein
MSTASRWLFVFILCAGLSIPSFPAWSQQKHAIVYSKGTGDSRYTQEHSIDVGDVPGHKVRIYEIHWNWSKGELAFGGVNVTESWARSFSDYTNGSGTAMNYIIYVLEDGSRVYSRNAVLTQTSEGEGGGKVLRYQSVETLYGGTGRFSRIRGQVYQSGTRVPGASALTLEGKGEYWFEE